MDNKEDVLAINRISECGLLIDQFLELYDRLRKRKFSKKEAIETSKDVINSFLLYKAGLVLEEEPPQEEVLEAD